MVGLDMELDFMGEQPAWFRLYTQICFIYSVPEGTSQTTITETLYQGLERLSTQFPWIAGQVVDTNTDPNGAPAYRIRPLERIPRLTIKNYTTDPNIPTFVTLQQAKFPMSMLQESVWAPCPTLANLGLDPTKFGRIEASEPASVFLLQANFIQGGLILCVNMQHNVADMTGQETVMMLLSKACRGEAFTKDEIRVGTMHRKSPVSLIKEKDWKHGKELEMQLIPAPEPPTVETKAPEPNVAISDPPPLPSCSWCYFLFSQSALETMKKQATQTLPSDFKGYITIDDALSALIYQSVLRTRSPRLSLEPDRKVTFARAVDARRYLDMPATYPGVLQNMTYTSHPLSELLSMPLGEVAAELRRQVDPAKSDITYATKSLLTFLSQPAKTLQASFTAKLKFDADVVLSSWSKVNAYHFDFGLGLGLPAAVRRPAFVPVESLFYLMPKARDGEIAAALCLRDEDLESLRQDTEFSELGEYIG